MKNLRSTFFYLDLPHYSNAPPGRLIIQRSGEIRLCEAPATCPKGKVPIPAAPVNTGKEL